jgi:energy-coupling factor transporter ATP-binding protein EcfA2
MSEPVISIEDVSFTYPGMKVRALETVDLTIGQGDVVGIVGQNGSGKTTLTKLMNGLLKPTTGRVVVDGVPTKGKAVQELAGRIGYVFQNPNHQLFARTVHAELAFGPRNIGVPEEEIEQRIAEVVEFFGLADLLEEHPYRCSFPYRKLIGIASIVTMKPSIILLDEPTTGQDHTTTSVINSLVRRLAESGTTIVCVSHDMPLLADVVQRVVVMKNSRVIADATPREVFADQALMSETNLSAPQVTDLSLRTTVPAGGDVALRVPELVDEIERMASARRAIGEEEKIA